MTEVLFAAGKAALAEEYLPDRGIKLYPYVKKHVKKV